MGFCPICGKDTKTTFCEEHTPVEFSYKDIKVKLCECGKHFYRSRWTPFKTIRQVVEKAAKDAIKGKVKITVEAPDDVEVEGIEKKKLIVVAKKNGAITEIPAKIIVEKCPVCSKKGTEYFVATLQIRPKDEDLFDFIKVQLDKDDKVFASKIIEQKDGWDFYISSNKFALKLGKKLTQSFKGELKTTKRHFGYDGQRSRNLYRSTVFFRREKKQKKI